MSDEHDCSVIRPQERDYFLDLHSNEWGKDLVELGWSVVNVDGIGTYSCRVIGEDAKHPGKYLQRSTKDAEGLREVILRFPSAPVYGIHRKNSYLYALTQRSNFHTLRLITRNSFPSRKPIRRIYLFHNGLNEVDRLAFYYQLADTLLLKDESSACIIRPMPAHLTRSPFPSEFAESPLDRYLADAGDLFRQFLRFMLESQWLLSSIVPLRSYGAITGMDLLAQGDVDYLGREDDTNLAEAIYRAWHQAFEKTKEKAGPSEEVTQDDVKSVVKLLRHLVGWKPIRYEPDEAPKEVLEPTLHAIGYSLGGYLAQSVFFSWPFAVSSCTSMFSGGTLRDIAPTAFAHPEEWQTVLHSLRYELESAMLDRRIDATPAGTDHRTICGIDANHYAYLDRIFNDVFLQDFRGFHRSRLSEFVARLLFVVGGNDPVMSLDSVLRSSPAEGINLIEIPNLPHFPWLGGREWREFWFPEVSGILRKFAGRTEQILAETHREAWWNREYTELVSGNPTKVGA